MTKKRLARPKSTVYRLNISFLHEDVFGKFPVLGKDVKRQLNICPKLDLLKGRILQLILINQNHRGLTNYTVAWETHQSNGLAHLDILLMYDKPISKSLTSFDYLLPCCPQDLQLLPDKKPKINITTYSATKLNIAVLEYGQKEDPTPLNTFAYDQSIHYLVLAAIKKDPYGYLSDKLRQDPYNFDLSEYAEQYNLDKFITSWSAVKYKLLDIRAALIARLQLQKPGFQPISRQLIQSKLNSEELATFDKHPCFQIIVDHLNQIPKYGSDRPHKMSNLFISGPKDIGKTSLAQILNKHVGCYNLKYQNKYLNRYSNHKYGFIIWNEVKLTDFSHTWILQFLEGVQVPIPMRYNACSKRDNPLIIMTSNLTLDQHIAKRYSKDPFLYNHAVQNLGARITAVHVPIPMFFMQKLLISKLEKLL